MGERSSRPRHAFSWDVDPAACPSCAALPEMVSKEELVEVAPTLPALFFSDSIFGRPPLPGNGGRGLWGRGCVQKKTLPPYHSNVILRVTVALMGDDAETGVALSTV